MYFQPRVIYRDPNEPRDNAIIRYFGSRVTSQGKNSNFMCAITGMPGSGKSWAGGSISEIYGKMFNKEFDPDVHCFFSLKSALKLVVNRDLDKKIGRGSILLFDEPQNEANARNWQSDVNQILNQLISTWRNQNLICLFCTPYLEFLDKQTRLFFNAEFKVLGFDKTTKLTKIKPRFLEWGHMKQEFYRKRLIMEYAVANKEKHNIKMLGNWHIPKPSDHFIDVYEAKKLKFTQELNNRLLKQLEDKEKQDNGTDKAQKGEVFTRLKQAFEQYGDDFISIQPLFPDISPQSLDKMLYFLRKSLKTRANMPTGQV
jgi:hypothetical protein